MTHFDDVRAFQALAGLAERPTPQLEPWPEDLDHAETSPVAHALLYHLRAAEKQSKDLSFEYPDSVEARRVRLILSEVRETVQAIIEGDLVETADGLSDINYVVYGTSAELGIPHDLVHNEVHRANMDKRFPDGTLHRDVANKVIKPIEHGWKPADVASVLQQAADHPLQTVEGLPAPKGLSHVDLRLHLSEPGEDDDYSCYNITGIGVINSSLSLGERDGLAESMAQSDRWQVDGANAVVTAVGSESVVEVP
ncbi:MazG-like nucleotide pyrophosphohydrolase [Gordonia phage Skog]|uniref:MazG-like nucleotide pyrophosphohydrolase n=1 Tax=Gordonia phage Skog TaxID=2704033 RepID=A0A6G6XJR0_9CAUD|nr:nucleotide pyrophosphohydrolase [Gordonia phage Skog]QIG58254.1 MazG-like nucleotide pyrophosphohydrolase [Gordonia phage Skog]